MVLAPLRFRKLNPAVLPRLWWGALLAIHLPILVAVCSAIVLEEVTLSRVGSLLALVLTMAFFALKMQDVWFLRLRNRQQAFVVFCLLTAIVHSNAIAPGVDRSVVLQGGAAALITTGVASEWLRPRRPRGTSWARRLIASFAAPRLILSAAWRRDREDFAPPPRWIPPAFAVPRAPPA